MSGTMTDGEVVTSFRQAKNKREQIGILSELNLCSKSDILNILCAAGEDVSDYISGRPKKKPAEKKSGAPAADAEAEASAPPDGVPAVPKSKSTHKWTAGDDGILCALRAEGKSEREIARAIGCSRQAVQWHVSKLKKAGMLADAKPAVKVCSGEAMAEADCGEAAEEQADAKVMAEGCGGDTAGADQSGKLGDILDMICRLVSAMACEPGKVHIDMPEDDAALLEMDFGSCAVRVTL